MWQKCQIGPSFSWQTLTDVMGRLPKHLIVDTVQWNHNTDLHDGCQIKMNPAMGFTSFEFMHGEACQGREMMWTLALTVCQDFTSLPLATRLKQVICCLAACCQYAWESRFNICGLLAGMNAIRLFCGCEVSLCIHHAIYHFNGPQLSQGTCFNLVTTLVYSLFYVSKSDSKPVTHLFFFFSLRFCLFGRQDRIKKYSTKSRLFKVEHQMMFWHQME